MTPPGSDLPPRPARDVPRRRLCLRCNAPFDSEGFGERICRHCKQSKSWRDGVSLAPASSKRR
jgi:hypothetical protein